MASKKNEAKLAATSGVKGPGAEVGRGRKIETRGRKPRLERPNKSAARRTNPGEERYLITIKSEYIEDMRDLAKRQNISLKDAYMAAIALYKSTF